MEQEVIVTTYWSCDCGATNPLRYKACHNCARPMPEAFRQQVFREELAVQKLFVQRKAFWKLQAKSNSTGDVLKQIEPLANLLLIFALVVSFAFLYFAGSLDVSDNAFFYMSDRAERLEQQKEYASTHFENIREIGGGLSAGFHWVVTGENEFTYQKEKTVKAEKIEYILDKFRGVWDYVSGKN